MLKCNVCGEEFPATKAGHYISRDNGTSGVMATFSKEKEVTIYDTFDCPACGCQYIAQVRKRGYIDFGKEGDDKEDGREENE